jgi:hypothetical protein
VDEAKAVQKQSALPNGFIMSDANLNISQLLKKEIAATVRHYAEKVL